VSRRDTDDATGYGTVAIAIASVTSAVAPSRHDTDRRCGLWHGGHSASRSWHSRRRPSRR